MSNNAWDLKRAAEFLGVSPRTLERYVDQRIVPGLIVLPPARGGARSMLRFDPVILAKWRAEKTIGLPTHPAKRAG